MYSVYRDILVARVQGAIAAAKSLARVHHSGLKGAMREILIRELFRPLFPADVGVGTGEIITVLGQHSKQQDVVIFDRRILPPLVLESATGLFPVESVLLTIEVKSLLTAGEMHTAHESALQLGTLRGLSGQFDPEGRHIRGKFMVPAATVFALDSDLTGDARTESERYDNVRESATVDPPILVLCVVGRGTWIWNRGAWVHLRPTPDLDEVAGFMAIILNNSRHIAVSRGAPPLGAYIADISALNNVGTS